MLTINTIELNDDQAKMLFESLELFQCLCQRPDGLFAFAEGMKDLLIEDYPSISGSPYSQETREIYAWLEANAPRQSGL